MADGKELKPRLEDNQNLTEIVRTEFDALLKFKDATTQDLQVKLSTAKQLKEEAIAKAKTRLGFPAIVSLNARPLAEITPLPSAISAISAATGLLGADI